jgi:hypothetical protein
MMKVGEKNIKKFDCFLSKTTLTDTTRTRR